MNHRENSADFALSPMAKFDIKSLIGKGKRKENSTTLPPLDESRNQEALAALPIDDITSTFAAQRSVANVLKQTIRTIGLIELSTNKGYRWSGNSWITGRCVPDLEAC